MLFRSSLSNSHRSHSSFVPSGFPHTQSITFSIYQTQRAYRTNIALLLSKSPGLSPAVSSPKFPGVPSGVSGNLSSRKAAHIVLTCGQDRLFVGLRSASRPAFNTLATSPCVSWVLTSCFQCLSESTPAAQISSRNCSGIPTGCSNPRSTPKCGYDTTSR